MSKTTKTPTTTTKTRTKKAEWAHIQQIIAKAAADTGGANGNGMIPSGLGAGKGLLSGMGKSAPQAPSTPAVAPQKPAIEPIPANVPPPPPQVPPASGLPPARRFSAAELAMQPRAPVKDVFGDRQQWKPNVAGVMPTGNYTRENGGDYVDNATGARYDQYGNPADGTYSADGNNWQAGKSVLENYGLYNGVPLESTHIDTSQSPQAPPTAAPGTVGEQSGQISGHPAGSPSAQEQAGQPVTAQNEPVKQPVTEQPPAVQDTELAPHGTDDSAPEADPVSTVTKAVNDPSLPLEAKQQVVVQNKDKLVAPEQRQLAADLQKPNPSPAAVEQKKQNEEKAIAEKQKEYVEQKQKENPNAGPQDFGQWVSEGFQHGVSTFQNMDPASQLLVGIGLPVGLIGILSSLFGEGGATGGILGALGLGAAGLAATNSGMFGNDARAALGNFAADTANFFGAAPDASAFTPEGMAKGQEEGQAAVRAAMDKAKAEGGNPWEAGQQAFNKAKAPLDNLNMLGPEAGTTMLMGVLKTKDPAVARAKYDELMKMREQFSAPDYLRNQALQAAQQEAKKQQGSWGADWLIPDSWANAGAERALDTMYPGYKPAA